MFVRSYISLVQSRHSYNGCTQTAPCGRGMQRTHCSRPVNVTLRMLIAHRRIGLQRRLCLSSTIRKRRTVSVTLVFVRDHAPRNVSRRLHSITQVVMLCLVSYIQRILTTLYTVYVGKGCEVYTSQPVHFLSQPFLAKT